MTSLGQLARVELQLVMQFCDQRTLLALAHCSRSTFAAADHPFAWRSLPPLQLQCPSPRDLPAQLIEGRWLMRHVALSVEWIMFANAGDAVDVEGEEAEPEAEDVQQAKKLARLAAETTAMASLPGLRGLTVHCQAGALGDAAMLLLCTALLERVVRGGALANLHINMRGCTSGEAGFEALGALVAHSTTLTALCVEGVNANVTMMRSLAAGVQRSGSLATLNLSGLTLREGAVEIAAGVAHCSSLTDLQLQACSIDDAGAAALAAALQQAGSIRTLHLGHNDFGAAGTAALARLLASDSCAVETLILCHTTIGDDGATALARSMQTNRTLTVLRLESCSIATEGTTALAVALQRNDHCALSVLDLSYNRVDAAGAAALADFLRVSSALERLDLSFCELETAGVAALAAGLPHSRSLRELSLRCVALNREGAEALAAGVGACPGLQTLDVSQNESLGNAGLAALAAALRHLDSLDVARCGLTSDCAATLASLVQHAPRLRSIGLHYDPIGSIGATALAASLGPSSALRTLQLRGCDIGADGAAALGAALARGWPAVELSLDVNSKIGDEGALALAAALDQCDGRCALSSLSLDDCNLTATGALALVRAAVRIPSLRLLSLRRNLLITAEEKPALVAECGAEPHFSLSV